MRARSLSLYFVTILAALTALSVLAVAVSLRAGLSFDAVQRTIPV